MKKFIAELLIIFFITFVVGEIICRAFPIVPDIPIKGNKQGYYLLTENQKGAYIRGKFPKWLSANYSVNNLGFNSNIDYLFNDHENKKIALIGDSFIEGFQVDVEKSIGRIMESINNKIRVYEFGLSGLNFFDYMDIYKKYNLQNFDYVFMVLDTNDVMADKSEKVIFTENLKIKEKFFRKIYNNFYFFKYLNWNHGFIREIFRLINNLDIKLTKSNPESFKPYDINSFVLDNKNIYLVMKSKKDTILKKYYPNLEFLSIKETLTPINFGFDQHWNLNGRKNVANSLLKYTK